MATTSPTRIDDELYAAAKATGARMSRSAAQQITHWARIGRELVSARSVAHRDIERVLAGEQDYDGLDARAQAIVRTAWSERSTARRVDLNFAQEFAAAGELYAESDEQGHVIERAPGAAG